MAGASSPCTMLMSQALGCLWVADTWTNCPWSATSGGVDCCRTQVSAWPKYLFCMIDVQKQLKLYNNAKHSVTTSPAESCCQIAAAIDLHWTHSCINRPHQTWPVCVSMLAAATGSICYKQLANELNQLRVWHIHAYTSLHELKDLQRNFDGKTDWLACCFREYPGSYPVWQHTGMVCNLLMRQLVQCCCGPQTGPNDNDEVCMHLTESV